jgi:hypothetical protein
MLTKPPIWEPEGTRYRPYNLSTLIFFYIGRFLGSKKRASSMGCNRRLSWARESRL